MIAWFLVCAVAAPSARPARREELWLYQCRPHALRRRSDMRTLMALCALALVVTATQPARGIDGGVIDTGTGLVWSPSESSLNGSMLNWTASVAFAANYSNID